MRVSHFYIGLMICGFYTGLYLPSYKQSSKNQYARYKAVQDQIQALFLPTAIITLARIPFHCWHIHKIVRGVVERGNPPLQICLLINKTGMRERLQERGCLN